jgi:acetyl esterase/lipase
MLGVLAQGYSVALTVAGLAGLGWSWTARGHGSGAVQAAAVALSAATVLVSLVPAWHGVVAARRHQVRLSLRAYGSRPTWLARRAAESLPYANPPDVPDGLWLDVWLPRDGSATGALGGRAAVVTVHGGGWISGGRGGVARWNEWLADRGFVVFDVDYRLAPPPRWYDAVDDVRGALAWVRDHAEHYGVDAGRLALLGYSAGAHLALCTAFAGPDADPVAGRVAAVAALYPITDLTSAHGRRRPRWSAEIDREQTEQFLGGPVTTELGAASRASPLLRADRQAPPAFVAHGTADQLVPIGQSRALRARLQELGVEHEVLELSGANHAYDLVWGAWSTQVTRELLRRFLDRHVGAPR